MRAALRKHFNNVPADQKFDALFAIDQSGRVIGEIGFAQSSSIEGFELGDLEPGDIVEFAVWMAIIAALLFIGLACWEAFKR